jgi:sugar phosphate isomerase/epimerase
VFDDDIAGPHQDEVVEELTQWLDLYLALGITAAVVHPGGHELAAQDATPERILEAQVRSFTRLTDHVTGDGLVICLENVSGAGQSIEDLWGIIDACGSDHLGICLDTGHLNMAGGDQAAFIRKAGPRLKALHLCDNDASSDQHLMPYGSGTVRWDRVVAALGELRYDGLLNFELPGEVLCPIPVRLAKMDYLRNVAEIMFGGAAA